jgi:hypothetical protein
MTKAEAEKRVWTILRATLELDLMRDSDWLYLTPKTKESMSTNSRRVLRQAAKDVLDILREKSGPGKDVISIRLRKRK